MLFRFGWFALKTSHLAVVIIDVGRTFTDLLYVEQIYYVAIDRKVVPLLL